MDPLPPPGSLEIQAMEGVFRRRNLEGIFST